MWRHWAKARNLLGLGYPMAEMNAMIAASKTDAPRGLENKRWPVIAAFLLLLFLGFEVIRHLKGEWSFNPQYSYGWSVPFLVIYLAWRRWLHRPPPARPTKKAAGLTFIMLAALMLGAARFLAEANPDWRLLSWGFAVSAVSISLGIVFLTGGYPWLRHFAFPFLFFLVAVPWPTQVEQTIVQNLMRAVTGINVLLLNFAGIPALQRGNVIEITSGLIGIEEACSGVRSLQATLMISLFLGELYSFRVGARFLLIAAGAALAFFFNVIRTAILVMVGVDRGLDAIKEWHDPAGLTILLLCLFGLWGLSLWMRRSANMTMPDSELTTASHSPWSIPAGLCLSLLIWLFAVEGGVQVWYRAHQSALAASRWAVRWPSSESNYQTVGIPPESEAILHYDEGGGANWTGPDAHSWTMYFFRWFPGHTAALYVKIHRPDVCLPASGLNLTRDGGIRMLAVNGVKLPVRSYRFDDHGVPLHVLYCYWDARSSYQSVSAATAEDWTARGRVRAALRGQREIGAQILELVVWGFDNDAEANAALERQLAEIVHAQT